MKDVAVLPVIAKIHTKTHHFSTQDDFSLKLWHQRQLNLKLDLKYFLLFFGLKPKNLYPII